jgi:hypothetical protein
MWLPRNYIGKPLSLEIIEHGVEDNRETLFSSEKLVTLLPPCNQAALIVHDMEIDDGLVVSETFIDAVLSAAVVT